MGRILAIDYGQKRVGIAVSDELRLIAGGLDTVHSKDIISFLKQYTSNEKVDIFVVGEPKQMNNTASQSAGITDAFVRQLQKEFPGIPVERIDERFTSKIALHTMQNSGLKKKDRQNKAMLDSISATLILQTYMETKH
jgi:putative Holliday junction resolvase